MSKQQQPDEPQRSDIRKGRYVMPPIDEPHDDEPRFKNEWELDNFLNSNWNPKKKGGIAALFSPRHESEEDEFGYSGALKYVVDKLEKREEEERRKAETEQFIADSRRMANAGWHRSAESVRRERAAKRMLAEEEFEPLDEAALTGQTTDGDGAAKTGDPVAAHETNGPTTPVPTESVAAHETGGPTMPVAPESGPARKQGAAPEAVEMTAPIKTTTGHDVAAMAVQDSAASEGPACQSELAGTVPSPSGQPVTEAASTNDPFAGLDTEASGVDLSRGPSTVGPSTPSENDASSEDQTGWTTIDDFASSGTDLDDQLIMVDDDLEEGPAEAVLVRPLAPYEAEGLTIAERLALMTEAGSTPKKETISPESGIRRPSLMIFEAKLGTEPMAVSSNDALRMSDDPSIDLSTTSADADLEPTAATEDLFEELAVAGPEITTTPVATEDHADDFAPVSADADELAAAGPEIATTPVATEDHADDVAAVSADAGELTAAGTEAATESVTTEDHAAPTAAETVSTSAATAEPAPSTSSTADTSAAVDPGTTSAPASTDKRMPRKGSAVSAAKTSAPPDSPGPPTVKKRFGDLLSSYVPHFLVVTVIILAGLFTLYMHFNRGWFTSEPLAYDLSPHAAEFYSKSMILMDNENGHVIADLNSDLRRQPAALTKLMTVLVAVDSGISFDKEVLIDKETYETLRNQNSAMAGFRPGENVTIRDLLYGTMLRSGSETASTLAIAVGGSIEGFVDMMNKKAKEMHLMNTRFANPTGIDAKDNYTSADDMAILLHVALENEDFREIFCAPTYKATNGLFMESQPIYSEIHLGLMPAGCEITGGKTGYTEEAGQCWATTVEMGSHVYIVVTMGAPYGQKDPPASLVDLAHLAEYIPVEEGVKITTIDPFGK